MTKGAFYIVRETTQGVEETLRRLIAFSGPAVILWVGTKEVLPYNSRLNRIFYDNPVPNAIMQGPIMAEPMIDEVAQTVVEALLKNAGCDEFVNATSLPDG